MQRRKPASQHRKGQALPRDTNVRRLGRLLGVCAVASLVWGCGPARIKLYDLANLPETVPAEFDDRDWATVLRENVKDGLVDYDHLAAHREPLDGFLQTLAVVGPRSRPNLFRSRRAKLAYYINAYNACVLDAVLHEGIPESMHNALNSATARLEHGYELLIDGQVCTLDDLREAVRVGSLGDARVEFCLCDAAIGSPALQPRPYRPDTLDSQLEQAAQEAMADPQMVLIDHEAQRLNVALIIHQRREAFLDYCRRQTGSSSATLLNVLLHMASGRRREWLNTAVGYEDGLIPFDRALNRWTPRESAMR
jgi:hypothetical protein